MRASLNINPVPSPVPTFDQKSLFEIINKAKNEIDEKPVHLEGNFEMISKYIKLFEERKLQNERLYLFLYLFGHKNTGTSSQYIIKKKIKPWILGDPVLVEKFIKELNFTEENKEKIRSEMVYPLSEKSRNNIK